jgi:hypothetical protein
LTVLGEPTLLGRRDLAEHFFVSVYLTTVLGDEAAHAAALSKELLEAQSGSGFSFADLAASRAGVRFAEGILEKRVPFGMLPQVFTIDAFMPSVDGLPEKLPAREFETQFGNAEHPKFREQLAEIDRRILALPAYRAPALQLGR